MMNGSEGAEAAIIVGRIMLAFVFLYGAIRRHFWLHPMAVTMLKKRGLPMTEPLIHAATLFQIVAGVMLALGIALLPVSLLLIAFTLTASFLMLDFWNKQGMERIGAESGWQSNIGIIGGLLIVAASAW